MKCLLLSVLGLAAAFPNNEGERTIGSSTYLVSLDAGHHFCRGALIKKQWVVSAAHCYKSCIKVRLGEHNIEGLEGTEQFITAEKIIPHPKYNSYLLDNDIMLIKLSQPAVLNAQVQTIRLPTHFDRAGAKCLVSGRRNTLSNGDAFPDQQNLDVDILSDKDCKNFYPRQITDNMMCAKFLECGNDSCQVDSGGPVVCNGVLQGVVTREIGSAQSGNPSIFTKVSNYLSWILRNIDEN